MKARFQVGQGAHKAQAIVNELLNSKYMQHTKIYTDGSKDATAVGCGIIGPNFKIEGQLPKCCSIFSAEAAALAIAVYHAGNAPTVILTDSASSLSALDKGNIMHPFIQAIETYSDGKQVTFLWIPGHCAISGNVEADQAAKKGRTSLPVEYEVPAIDAIMWTKNKINNQLQISWNENTVDNLALVKQNIGKWCDQKKKSDQRILTRCRIGHTRLTKCHLFQNKDPEICDSCNTPLDVKHILLECRKFDDIRNRIGINSNIAIALGNNKNEEEKMLKYLKDTGLYSLL